MLKSIQYFGWLVTILILNNQSAISQDLGAWQTRAFLPTARQEVPHAVLNGKIYVPGGFTASRSVTNFVEVFDPSTNSWSSAAPLPIAMHHLHLTPANGKLYVLGGYRTSGFVPTNRVFEFDSQANSWTEKSNMPTSRGAAVAVTVDNKIYVIGGVAGTPTGLNEMYDPVTDIWTNKASMPTRREHLAAAVINSMIYVIGGRSADFTNKRDLEVYSPETDNWQYLARMPTARGGLAAAAVNGRLYVFGGEFFDTDEGTKGVFDETEEYNPATNTWRQLHPMLVPRHGIGAATVDDRIYIIGGGPVAGFGVARANTVFIPPAVVTDVDQDHLSPTEFELHQNYPNPFNPSTVINFQIGSPGFVSIKVFDILGHEIATLVKSELNPGAHSVTWDATGSPGGVYFYQLKTKNVKVTKKMLLVF